MRVTLDAVRYPLPGLTLLEGFRAYDPETDALVLEAARLEAEPSTEGLALAASQMEVFADKGARLFAALERRLKRELPDAELQVRCEFDQLTWHTAAGPQTVTHFDALVGPTESGRQLLVNFRPADVGGGARVDEPASLRLARTNAASGAETTVELATGTTPLPCSMFAPLVPAAADLGAEALVDGRLKLKHLPQGWEGVLSGTLRQVDFQRLVGEHSSQQLWSQGRALLALAAAVDAGLIEDTHAVLPRARAWCRRRFALYPSHGAGPWLMQALVAFGEVDAAVRIADHTRRFQSKRDSAFLTGQQDDCPGCTRCLPSKGWRPSTAPGRAPR